MDVGEDGGGFGSLGRREEVAGVESTVGPNKTRNDETLSIKEQTTWRVKCR